MVITTDVTKFTQLTAPGVTPEIVVTGKQNHTFQYVVAAINTDVTVNAQGSLDGTNWFDLATATVTANGAYGYIVSNTILTRIRFNFVSETGGTTATIDASHISG